MMTARVMMKTTVVVTRRNRGELIREGGIIDGAVSTSQFTAMSRNFKNGVNI